ncbi:MAG: hypothetical protein A2156_00025 [Deltaproteobacteria bacterium RBG_16_48_10]|nr:MAG: hypothetical protein A2156_00025 [Deltaproteobacteria bacterium RBG_16_48_10]
MRMILWLMIAGSFLFFILGTALAKDPGAPKKTPELLTQGKKTFEQACSPCHGSKGDGKGPAGAVLNPPPTNFTKPLKEWPSAKGDLNKVFEVITKGIPNSSMIAWPQYSEQERWALAYTAAEFAAPTPKKGK